MIEILVKGYIRMSGFPRSCHFLILFFLFPLRQTQPSFWVAFQKTTERGERRCIGRCRKVPLGKASPAKVLSRKLWPTRQQNGKLGGETSNMPIPSMGLLYLPLYIYLHLP